ncbi:rhodanese-like domain-containing protein [Paenibacillus marinisediminis]
MNYLNILILALLVGFIVYRMLPTKGVKQITTADLKQELKDKSKQFVDVRTPGEFKNSHINGFKNIPLNELDSKAPTQLSKDAEVVVICQSGMRSNKACKALKKLGYEHVTNVKGGMSAWS